MDRMAANAAAIAILICFLTYLSASLGSLLLQELGPFRSELSLVRVFEPCQTLFSRHSLAGHYLALQNDICHGSHP